ncbi:MAG: universal stress protein [Thaumarchaeota archaeon]|nr:universal stress protein [Nitrososphaerota archaeon]
MILRKILVPFDGSPLSKKALILAKDIARNFNAELTLLMMIPPYYPIGDSMFSGASEANYRRLLQRLMEKEKKRMAKATEKCREEGVKASYKIANDDISQGIVREAKRARSDLIIMGSRRLTGLSSIRRLGSSARYVSEHAKCPVTIVH